MSKLEEDGEEILKFMASNGLVENPTKITLLIMNNKEEGAVQVTVGNALVLQEKTSKLLGVKIDDDMN